MSGFKVTWGAGGRTAKPPFSRSQEAQKCPVLIGLLQFDSILFYFLITIIISIHLSRSFILFHNVFRSRSNWYWSTSKETISIRRDLSELLDQGKAENFSQTAAFCFMVTNRSELEMDKCEANHYYICGEYRGR